MNKIIGFKKNPHQIRSIKPFILSEVCLKSDQFHDLTFKNDKIGTNVFIEGAVDLIFKFSRSAFSEK